MEGASETGRNHPHAGGEPYRVLLAEDDPEMRGLLAHALHHDGYMVDECRDGHHLVARLVSADPGYFDIIVTDIRMPGLNGLDFLEQLRRCANVPPAVLITAFGDEETHNRAHRLGAAAILDKPFDIGDLLTTVRNVFTTHAPAGAPHTADDDNHARHQPHEGGSS